MVDRTIGYYAHHQGAGHVTRALAIAEHLPLQMTLFGSTLPKTTALTNVTLCRLPVDYDQQTQIETPDGLHYAPLKIDGLRERMGLLVDWFRSNWPCLLVVDVSVEVALLARLCGVPTIYVRQRGNRSDPAHGLAYECASRLLAPYPAQLEEPDASLKWICKTDYAGSISRYGGGLPERRNEPQIERQIEPQHVTVITGFGGTDFDIEQIAEAARRCHDWHWTVVGPVVSESSTALPPNLRILGLVPDPQKWLVSAHVVVGSAGDSLVSEIADLRCRFICVPEARPFDEQQSVSKGLAASGLAIHCETWPLADAWPALLVRATELLPGKWEAFSDGNAAARAATAISRAAQEVLS